MKKIFFIIAIIFLYCSCRWYIGKKYKTNRPFKFKTKSEYIAFLQRTEKFNPKNIIYADSATFRQAFGLAGNPYSVYYGSFINDSIMIKKSDYLMENEACMGRMDGEIKKNIARKQFVDSFFIKNNTFKILNLLSVGNIPIRIDNSNHRLKVLLLYFYSQGTVYDYIYKEVNKTYAGTNEAFDLYILLLDPVYRLPD